MFINSAGTGKKRYSGVLFGENMIKEKREYIHRLYTEYEGVFDIVSLYRI